MADDIDVIDGLAGDLGHILKALGVGARVDTAITMNLVAACARIDWARAQFDTRKQLKTVLSGGDDYELAFTAPTSARQAVLEASISSQTPVTRIGVIEAEQGLQLVDGHGQSISAQFASFDHFAA